MCLRSSEVRAEGLGYTRQVVFDHVLGAGLASRPRWEGTYDADDPFYEPFVLFGYLAGLTERIELVTGVLVLPQRQTASSPSKLPRLTSVRRPDATGRRRRVNDVEYQGLGCRTDTRSTCSPDSAVSLSMQAEILRRSALRRVWSAVTASERDGPS